jgi:GT2 family glycosyltransferase
VPSPCLVKQKRLMLRPSHQWRFYQQDHILASTDQRCFAVTGALHVINTKDFVDLGGYSCCLASSYQDIDLCQRAVQKQLPVYYIGSEFMFHAETITNVDGQNINNSRLYQSDRLVYEYIWQPQIQKLLGMT